MAFSFRDKNNDPNRGTPDETYIEWGVKRIRLEQRSSTDVHIHGVFKTPQGEIHSEFLIKKPEIDNEHVKVEVHTISGIHVGYGFRELTPSEKLQVPNKVMREELLNYHFQTKGPENLFLKKDYR